MAWSDVVLIIGLSGILGLPVLAFTLYWIAEFLEFRVEEQKRRLTAAGFCHLRSAVPLCSRYYGKRTAHPDDRPVAR